jgi:hypothetical protein
MVVRLVNAFRIENSIFKIQYEVSDILKAYSRP